MQRNRIAAVLIGSAALTLAFGAGVAVGQGPIPKESKGVSADELRSLDLTEEIENVMGRPLRLRKISLAPGGVLGLHTHKDRPAVSYMLEGEVTYYQEGKPDTVARAGDGIAEGRSTTHWGANRGSVTAIWIACDIPK
jgi:quercetin dioxygenase-like cupin family protein